MKRLLLILLASSLLLASCGGSKNNENNDANNNDSVITTPDNDENTADNSGVTDGDNVIEDIIPGEDGAAADNNSAAADSAEIPEGGVTAVTTGEEAVTFIDVNVYSQCMDVLPMSTMSMILPTEDMDTVTYNTGLTDLTGVNEIIVSESMIGSFAYSLVMVRTDGTNTDEIQTALGEQINPRKWLCVGADQIRTVRLDNDIVLVMSDNGRTEPVMNAVVAAASAVYENVGTVVNVLG